MPAKLTVILSHRIHLLYIIDALNVGNFVRLFGRPPVVVWHDDSLGKIRKTPSSHILSLLPRYSTRNILSLPGSRSPIYHHQTTSNVTFTHPFLVYLASIDSSYFPHNFLIISYVISPFYMHSPPPPFVTTGTYVFWFLL